MLVKNLIILLQAYESVDQNMSKLSKDMLELKTAYSGHAKDVKPLRAMPKFYKSIDCLVLASRSEGCNNPTLEALAMNKPVISTKVGIAKELEGVMQEGTSDYEFAWNWTPDTRDF